MPDNLERKNVSRRGMVFAALGVGGLAACESRGNAQGSQGTVVEDLSGTTVAWIDTVLGASPPAPPTVRTTGDLATNTSTMLGGAVMAFAKGCIAQGDGGGGVFYWDSGGGTDDGGTVIVPNANVGSTGSCWRKVIM